MTTTIRNGNFFCTCCGSEYKLKVPCPVKEMAKKSEAFELLHKDCEQTWEEPTPNMAENTQKRAMWWLEKGEHGISSRAMWNCFMGRDKCDQWGDWGPSDPSDFKRCHKLLEAVPEWKERLQELKKLSLYWSNLVDNWDRLNEYLEDQLKTGKKNGMYEFMKSLSTR